MQQRRITLEDGRYLIFYTFADEAAPSPASSDVEREKEVKPPATSQAEEEER